MASATSTPNTRSFLSRFLGTVERLGNALPHPATLFAGLCVLVVLLSALCSQLGVSVTHPGNGTTVKVVNLLSVAGLQRMLVEAVQNFVAFPPLGVALMCLLGIGMAEQSGFMGAMLRLVVQATPARFITMITVFIGVIANAGSEIGYVLVVPMAAALFHALGRHPLLGLAAAFAGVSGGYSANVLLGAIDVLLAGLSEAAARIVDPTYVVRPTANYYFMAASTFVITAIGTWVTERIVAPRLGAYAGAVQREDLHPLTTAERRGLLAAVGAAVALVAAVFWGVLPADGFLLDPKSARLSDSAFMRGLVSFIFLFGLVPGVVYGFVSGKFKSDHDVMNGMTASMKSLASYIVMAFFAAQFIAYFNWTNLGVVTAVGGAHLIESIGLKDTPVLLMVALVAFAATVNLLITSASAKWALLAPVFVPMFMLLGYTPELVQVAFRVGDSVTNIVTPLMNYFPLVLTFVQRYEPKAGVGTMVATMLPYSVAFGIGWTLLLIVWIWFGIPVGPGAPLLLPR